MIAADRILGVIGLLLGGAFIWSATTIETGFIVDPLGPKSFPIIIGGVLMLASLVVILKPDPAPAWPALERLLEIGGAVLVLVGYVLLLEPVGFVGSTAVASALLSWRLGSAPRGALVTGVGISLGIYVVFHLVLGLSLAKGPLGF